MAITRSTDGLLYLIYSVYVLVQNRTPGFKIRDCHSPPPRGLEEDLYVMANLLPAPMSPSLAQSQPSQSGTKLPPSFDFEKRKRWADLLLTELVDNVPFVLSSTSKIWFCGVAVTEILGWKDIDLIDLDFTDLIESACCISCLFLLRGL